MEISKQQIIDFVKAMSIEQKQQLSSILNDNLNTATNSEVDNNDKRYDLYNYDDYKVVKQGNYTIITGFEDSELLSQEMDRLSDEHLVVEVALFKIFEDGFIDVLNNFIDKDNKYADEYDMFDMKKVIEGGYEFIDYAGEYYKYKVFSRDDIIDMVNEIIRLADNEEFEMISDESSSYAEIYNDYENKDEGEIVVYKDNYSNYEVISRYVMEFDNGEYIIAKGLLVSE